MAIYKEFAYLYNKGWYGKFSLSIAKIFPSLLNDLGITPTSLLDIACGIGDFAIEMAKKGIETIGVDFSRQMIDLAIEKAAQKNVSVQWLVQDITKLNLGKKVEVVTCWFDSLNYILEWSDLRKVFQHVYHSLTPGGYFLFDMNTRFGLINHWNKYPCYVPQNNHHVVEIHEPSFDYEENIASIKVTGFIKEGHLWRRVTEIHREKAYPLHAIRKAFEEAGFIEILCLDNIALRTPFHQESGRVYFILKSKE